jgi:hypothetical protein
MLSDSEHQRVWRTFLDGVKRGYADAGPALTLEMPDVLDQMRTINMTQAQRIAVANALRDVADRIENEEV